MNLPVKAELSAIESSTRSSEMIERKYQKGISEPGLWQCTREPEVDDMKALLRLRNTSKGMITITKG